MSQALLQRLTHLAAKHGAIHEVDVELLTKQLSHAASKVLTGATVG